LSIFIYHKLIEDKNNKGYILNLYLDPSLVEFSRELDAMDDEQKEAMLGKSIKDYIKDNFKNLKINTVKIMIGSILIATISFTVSAVEVTAASPAQSLASHAVVQKDRILINGQEYNFSQAPLVINGITYVSIDDIIRMFGAQVWWNDQSQTVGINKGSIKIAFILGSGKARVNGKQVGMNPSFVYNGKTMVPLRFVSESLGMTVKWDGDTKTITIASPDFPAGTPAETFTYTVKPGDSLWKLANQFNTSVDKLKSLNNLSGDMIYVGQLLKISLNTSGQAPKETSKTQSENTVTYISYTIKPGDSMWDLSIKYGIPMAELLKVNNMNENSLLSVGQKIKIPVHNIAVQERVSEKHGEYLDWWTEAQYVFPINKVATVTDFQTGRTFKIKRTTGAFHADCEPLTARDAAIIKEVWGGSYSWTERAVIVVVDGRKIAASMSSMPHDVEYIKDNNFNGHFDLHFRNSTRHKDGMISQAHQAQIRIAAGV
jgi:LysM repeat protein